MLEYPLLLVFPLAMTFAAAFDLFTMTIPNKISLALVAAFAVVAPMVGLTFETIGIHVLTGGAVLIVGFICFARGWLGGGDAKLLAAAALWLGYDSLPIFMVQVGLLGGVLSVSILAYRRFVPDGMIMNPAWLVNLHTKDSGVPYGIAIGAAALLTYPNTLWFAALLA
jgi:prepilin peptidase CpaA